MTIITPEWVKDAVFYQIFPDRFARSDRVKKDGLHFEAVPGRRLATCRLARDPPRPWKSSSVKGAGCGARIRFL